MLGIMDSYSKRTIKITIFSKKQMQSISRNRIKMEKNKSVQKSASMLSESLHYHEQYIIDNTRIYGEKILRCSV